MIHNYNLQPGTFNYNNLDVDIKFGMNLDKWLFKFLKSLGLSPNLNCTTNCWQNSLFLKQGSYLYTSQNCKEYFNLENYVSHILLELGLITEINNIPVAIGSLTLSDDSEQDSSPCGGLNPPYLITNSTDLNNIEFFNGGSLTWESGTYPNLNVKHLVGSIHIGDYVRILDGAYGYYCFVVTNIDPPNMYSYCNSKSQLHIYSNLLIPKNKNYNKKGSLYNWLINRIVSWSIDNNPTLLCCN